QQHDWRGGLAARRARFHVRRLCTRRAEPPAGALADGGRQVRLDPVHLRGSHQGERREPARLPEGDPEGGADLQAARDVVAIRDVTVSGAYTYSDFTFAKYLNATSDFAGNRLPGVPEHVLFGALKYQSPIGISLGGDVRMVSPFFFNDANGKDFKPTEHIAAS